MTDPERLLDTDGGGLSAALLRAGRAEGPSDKLLADTLVAAGIGAAVVGAGAAATALGAGSGSALRSLHRWGRSRRKPARWCVPSIMAACSGCWAITRR